MADNADVARARAQESPLAGTLSIAVIIPSSYLSSSSSSSFRTVVFLACSCLASYAVPIGFVSSSSPLLSLSATYECILKKGTKKRKKSVEGHFEVV